MELWYLKDWGRPLFFVAALFLLFFRFFWVVRLFCNPSVSAQSFFVFFLAFVVFSLLGPFF